MRLTTIIFLAICAILAYVGRDHRDRRIRTSDGFRRWRVSRLPSVCPYCGFGYAGATLEVCGPCRKELAKTTTPDVDVEVVK